MISDADRVLHIVLRTHAGFLSSFAADSSARLFRAHEIIEECEEQVTLFALCALWGDIRVVREETNARLRRFAPGLVSETYLSTHTNIQHLHKKRRNNDRRNEQRRQQRLRGSKHIEQV